MKQDEYPKLSPKFSAELQNSINRLLRVKDLFSIIISGFLKASTLIISLIVPQGNKNNTVVKTFDDTQSGKESKN